MTLKNVVNSLTLFFFSILFLLYHDTGLECGMASFLFSSFFLGQWLNLNLFTFCFLDQCKREEAEFCWNCWSSCDIRCWSTSWWPGMLCFFLNYVDAFIISFWVLLHATPSVLFYLMLLIFCSLQDQNLTIIFITLKY